MSVAPSAEKGSLPGRDARTASLTFRLVVYVALVLALGSAGVAVAALAYGHRAAQQAYDRLLVGAANAIAGSISVRGPELVVDLPTSAFELLALAPDDRVVYAVFGPDGSLITGYEGIAAQRRPDSRKAISGASRPALPACSGHSPSAASPVRSKWWSAKPPGHGRSWRAKSLGAHSAW